MPIKFTPRKNKMTGWKIHHEWVDVFPIEHGGFSNCSVETNREAHVCGHSILE